MQDVPTTSSAILASASRSTSSSSPVRLLPSLPHLIIISQLLLPQTSASTSTTPTLVARQQPESRQASDTPNNVPTPGTVQPAVAVVRGSVLLGALVSVRLLFELGLASVYSHSASGILCFLIFTCFLRIYIFLLHPFAPLHSFRLFLGCPGISSSSSSLCRLGFFFFTSLRF